MDFGETFPLAFFLNLSRRPDRRMACEDLFVDQDLAVQRFPAIDARWFATTAGIHLPGATPMP